MRRGLICASGMLYAGLTAQPVYYRNAKLDGKTYTEFGHYTLPPKYYPKPSEEEGNAWNRTRQSGYGTLRAGPEFKHFTILKIFYVTCKGQCHKDLPCIIDLYNQLAGDHETRKLEIFRFLFLVVPSRKYNMKFKHETSNVFLSTTDLDSDENPLWGKSSLNLNRSFLLYNRECVEVSRFAAYSHKLWITLSVSA